MTLAELRERYGVRRANEWERLWDRNLTVEEFKKHRSMWGKEYIGKFYLDTEAKPDPALFAGIRIHEGNPKKGDAEGVLFVDAIDHGSAGGDGTAVVSGHVDKAGVYTIDKVWYDKKL